jgi:hypothetical protein
MVYIVRKLPGLISPIWPSDPAVSRESERPAPFNFKVGIRPLKHSLKSKKNAESPVFQSEKRATPSPPETAGHCTLQACTDSMHKNARSRDALTSTPAEDTPAAAGRGSLRP